MKKNLFLLSAGVAFLLVSCASKKEEGGGGMSDNAKKNLEVSHVVTKAFMSGDVSAIDSVIAADFVDHTPEGDMNRDSLKHMITTMHNGTQNIKMDIINEAANDEYAYAWIRMSGTSDGSMGMPKGPFEMTAIELVKCKDGKAVEHWEMMEAKEMMKMMGNHQGPPPPPADNKMDTTKKSDSKM